ncbi:hypothetical protein [Cryptosporangium japonicum]|uniref:WD40 repeat domain-containing protein n=1 Tax=Cryptosporangium japonicum TaxID=80872 RepID=A0ABN0V514_9ACTN
MAETVEAALARTLDRAAEAAPVPGPDLAASLTRRHYQRANRRVDGRGRLMVVAAAFAVVAVLATGVTAVRTIRDGHPPTTGAEPGALAFLTPAAPVVERADYPDGATVEDVWPSAYSKMTGSFPIYRFLAGGRVLVGSPSSAENTDDQVGRKSSIVSVDTVTGATRAISPAGQSHFAVGEPANAGAEKWVVWAVSAPDGRGEIWRAPVDGGAAARVTTLPPIKNVHVAELRLTVVDDVVLIDPYPGVDGHRNFGVLWVPLDGSSAPAVIPGSHDYRYLQWPWFGSTAVMNNSTIWNAVTGERQTTPLSWKSMSCSRSWCVGREQDVVVVGRRDGADVREIALGPGGGGYRIVADRFVVGAFVGSGALIYDLVARKYLRLPRAGRGEQWRDAQLSAATSTDPFYLWTVTTAGRPDSLRVLRVGEMR